MFPSLRAISARLFLLHDSASDRHYSVETMCQNFDLFLGYKYLQCWMAAAGGAAPNQPGQYTGKQVVL